MVRFSKAYHMTNRVKDALAEVLRWATENSLTLSAEKCEYTILAPKGIISRIPPVRLNGVSLRHTKTLKYLGVTIDREYSWKPHIKMKGALLSIQRGALLAIAKSYRTTSTKGVAVLAGVIPLDIRA
ncbi:reverse transcriptase [Lasius niger]|uniref:Reverse transcriptase n=1 Tax=Lasius niger TaxID=67767 RepID=A0A0J7JSW2_LASNI|nr:reverse transcriptase [Lasius niger]